MSTRTPSNLRASLRATLFALSAIAAVSSVALARAADDDPMAAYRERFKAGMERYKAGDLSTAIASWESIYREVGAEKGYRIAFDLGRAYDKSGDEVRAAERYLSFVQIVDQRRSAGVALETTVLQEETEARERLGQINAINAAKVPASIDAGAAPPASTASAPPPAAAPPPTPSPVPPPTSPPTAAPAASPPAPSPEPSPTRHPFSPVLLFATGGVTVAAIAVCAVEYANALSQENAFNAAAGQPVSVQAGLKSSYDGTVPIAYGALGASVGLAAITAGLTVWYFAGTKSHEPAVTPTVSIVPGGGGAGIVGRF